MSVLAGQFAAIADIAFDPRFNISPTQPIAAVRIQPESTPPQRELVPLRWGLIPGWAKDSGIGNRLINARSETAAEKPAFRAAFRRRRCLIPADGFFEWQRQNKTSQPYYIQMADESPFAMAGLWESWAGPDHVVIDSCTILTTQSNVLMEPIHDRMPVILPDQSHAEWLDPGQSDPKSLERLLIPFDALRMKLHPVSAYVNRPGNEGSECIAPISAFF